MPKARSPLCCRPLTDLTARWAPTRQVACKQRHAAQEGGAEEEALQAGQAVGQRGARHRQQRNHQHLTPSHTQQQGQQLLERFAAAATATPLPGRTALAAGPAAKKWVAIERQQLGKGATPVNMMLVHNLAA